VRGDLTFSGLLASSGRTYVEQPLITMTVRGVQVMLHGDPQSLSNLPEGEYVAIIVLRKVPVKS
jgi:hypothetical protein